MRVKVRMTDDRGPYKKDEELTMSREQADTFISEGVAEEMELPPREVPPLEVDNIAEESETKE